MPAAPPPGDDDHWPLHARQWSRVGVPLRPSAADVAIAAREVAAWAAARGRPPRALLLGVTPELAAMAWPAGTTLAAVDRSAAMVAAVFPSPGTPGLPAGATATAGDWRALAAADAAFDVVLGDGCLACLPYAAGYRALAAELRRVVAADGMVALRLFALPEPADAEPLAAVAAALRAGRIASFHALKWQIAMAIAPPDRNVAVVEILRAFDAIAPDRAALPWPPDVVATIDVYRDSDAVYSFPTEAEARAALAPELDVIRIARVPAVPEVPDPARYPWLVLRPR